MLYLCLIIVCNTLVCYFYILLDQSMIKKFCIYTFKQHFTHCKKYKIVYNNNNVLNKKCITYCKNILRTIIYFKK